VQLESGQARSLAVDMRRFLQDARQALAAALESETSQRRRREVTKPLERQQEEALAAQRAEAQGSGIAVELTWPDRDGAATGRPPMSPEKFGRLPDSVHARYQAGLESLRPHIQEFLIRLRTLQGEAGASAQSEYDRRRQRQREHARETLGLVGTVLAHVIEGPPSTKSWAQGARGERRTAVRLEKHLAEHPVKLIHDGRIPGYGQANLDHLAVGPVASP
jgi:hypothetical protein